ncbi:MAG: TA system antitoxin ParD family protein [Methylococcaceae bacterium]
MTSITVSEKIAQAATIQAKVFNRTLDGQINYWAKIGKISEENPDLSFAFIKDVLIAGEEALAGDTEHYLFD